MLTALSWLPFVALLAPAGSTPPHPSAVLARPVADTDYVIDSIPDPILLTPSVLASYVEVEKALKMYWAEHPEDAQASLVNAHRYVVITEGVSQTRRIVKNYASLAQRDTGLVAVLTKSHVDPAQLGLIEISVDHAIMEALQYHTVDVGTVLGKNMAAVRAHQQDLTEDWNMMRSAKNMTQMIGGALGSPAKGIPQP